MDLRESAWFQLQCRRAALAAGELMHTLSASRNQRMATELARLRREAEEAMGRFQAANDADGEVEPEASADDELCDSNACAGVELMDGGPELGAHYAGMRMCKACINGVLEQMETDKELARDFQDEVGP